jgi:hypothetical protein
MSAYSTSSQTFFKQIDGNKAWFRNKQAGHLCSKLESVACNSNYFSYYKTRSTHQTTERSSSMPLDTVATLLQQCSNPLGNKFTLNREELSCTGGYSGKTMKNLVLLCAGSNRDCGRGNIKYILGF